MPDFISRAEFTAVMSRLYTTIDDGFNGVNERLDSMNSRTGDIEEQVAVLKAEATHKQSLVAHGFPAVLGVIGGAIVKFIWR